MKVASVHEGKWHLAGSAPDWAFDQARMMRNMLRHVSQSIIKTLGLPTWVGTGGDRQHSGTWSALRASGRGNTNNDVG